ncbi:hypothetical protein ACG94V_01760 [Acinetobacter sp. ULE_I001]|uniref:hypothetical protein n=1 Tax=unclassified Acinetobacter TaxID=196816 RepID=UPI003AF73504
MKMIKSLCVITAILATPSLYAQTNTQNQTQPYGDNPNIFKVLAHKTGEAVQNTAEKVGDATEKGIQKIKPSLDETIENTKKYTTEKATEARDSTRQGIDTAVKKVEQTKDRVMGKTSLNVPIEHGSLSQSSTTPNTTNTVTAATTANVQNTPITTQPVQPAVQNQLPNNGQEEPEIKKQSLPIEKQKRDVNTNTTGLKDTKSTNTQSSTDDEVGVPR